MSLLVSLFLVTSCKLMVLNIIFMPKSHKHVSYLDLASDFILFLGRCLRDISPEMLVSHLTQNSGLPFMSQSYSSPSLPCYLSNCQHSHSGQKRWELSLIQVFNFLLPIHHHVLVTLPLKYIVCIPLLFPPTLS